MDTQDLRVKTDDQLLDELTKLKKEQFNMRFQQATGQLQNTARVRVIRRTIAKIRTMQAERAAKSAAAVSA